MEMLTPFLITFYLLVLQLRFTYGNILLKITQHLLENIETICVFSEKSGNQYMKLPQLTSLSNVTIKSFDLSSPRNVSRCEFSLVDIDEEATLEKLLNSTLMIFSPHSRVLMILTNLAEFDKEIFFNISLKNNLDILMFNQNIQTNLLNAVGEADTSLYSVRRRKILLKGDEVYRNLTQILSRPKWHPLDMVKELNVTFIILGYARSPYVMGTDENPLGIDVGLIKLILRDIPLKFELVRDVINPFRYMDNRIMKGTSDLNLGALWLTYNLVVHGRTYTTAYYQQCLKLAVHKPVLLPDATFMFQYFQLSLWMLLFLVIVILAIFISSLEWVKSSNFPLGGSLLVVLSILIGGSFEGNLSKTLVMDITFLFWSLSSLLIATYSNSGLTTLMQLPRFTQDINAFQDMVDMKIRWIFKIAAMKKLVHSFGGIHSQVADLFIHQSNPLIINKLIRTGHYGTIVESLPGRMLVNIDVLDDYSRSHLKVIDECFLNDYLIFVLQHDSPYLDHINKRILKLVSFGFVDMLIKKVVTSEQKKVSNMFYSYYSGDTHEILNLSRIQGAFWLLTIGWALGIILFLWSLFNKRKCT